MKSYVKIENLSAGYSSKAVIKGLSLELPKGAIMSIIGPNGAGKSTLLKTITGDLKKISGNIFIGDKSLDDIKQKELAMLCSVVLTGGIDPGLMTVREVVSLGRYPYTNAFGRLEKDDLESIEEAMEITNLKEIEDCYFSELSDGQKQRVMLARAICQEPELMLLDEPTSFLDIRYKIEFLEILKVMAKKKNVTVIMAIHEIDLAEKISDYLLMLSGNDRYSFGKTEDVFLEEKIDELFDMKKGTYSEFWGSDKESIYES